MRSGELLRTATAPAKEVSRLEHYATYIVTFCDDQPAGPAIAQFLGVMGEDSAGAVMYDNKMQYIIVANHYFDLGRHIMATVLLPGSTTRAGD